jgi:hypothetical protein
MIASLSAATLDAATVSIRDLETLVEAWAVMPHPKGPSDLREPGFRLSCTLANGKPRPHGRSKGTQPVEASEEPQTFPTDEQSRHRGRK